MLGFVIGRKQFNVLNLFYFFAMLLFGIFTDEEIVYSKSVKHSASCNCANSVVDEKKVPECASGIDKDDVHGRFFKNKSFTFKEGEFYKLSDLMNVDGLPDYIKFNFFATPCGITLSSNNRSLANKHVFEYHQYGIEFDENHNKRFCVRNNPEAIVLDGKRAYDISLSKSDLDKYYIHVVSGRIYSTVDVCYYRNAIQVSLVVGSEADENTEKQFEKFIDRLGFESDTAFVKMVK